jgi:hypothetical protein
MTRIDRTISFEIPDYWTPEQAYAVFELLQSLCECILSHYETQIIDELKWPPVLGPWAKVEAAAVPS